MIGLMFFVFIYPSAGNIPASPDAACMLGAIVAYEKAKDLIDPSMKRNERSLEFYSKRIGKLSCRDQQGGARRQVFMEIIDAEVDAVLVSVEVESMKVCGVRTMNKCGRNPGACDEE